MLSSVLMHVVTSAYISCPRAFQFICITQAAEKGWKCSLSGAKVQRRVLMCSIALAVWLLTAIGETCPQNRRRSNASYPWFPTAQQEVGQLNICETNPEH